MICSSQESAKEGDWNGGIPPQIYGIQSLGLRIGGMQTVLLAWWVWVSSKAGWVNLRQWYIESSINRGPSLLFIALLLASQSQKSSTESAYNRANCLATIAEPYLLASRSLSV